MTNCSYLPLPEVLSFIVDNRGKTVPTSKKGIPLIATNCIKNNELYPVFEKIRYLSEDTYKNWFRAHPIPGDIIFVNKGSPGTVCLVPDPVGFCIAQDMMAFRVKEKKINNKYLFAVLRSPQFQTQIEQFHVGTLIPHFKKGDLDKLLIPIPSMDIQNFIGETYYELCNKIELNNHINKTLEEVAQAIFKSWFVDFEPFQDGEFEDSELGRIPKGWRVVELGDIVKFIKGKKPKELIDVKDSYFQEQYLTIDALNGGIPQFANIEKMVLANMYDILMVMDGASSGTVYFGLNGIIASTIGKVEVKNEQLREVVYQYLKINESEVKTHNTGSAIPHADKGYVSRIKIAIPPEKELNEIESILLKIREVIINNKMQEKTLSTIRDSLLPKLMSGEIRIPTKEVK